VVGHKKNDALQLRPLIASERHQDDKSRTCRSLCYRDIHDRDCQPHRSFCEHDGQQPLQTIWVHWVVFCFVHSIVHDAKKSLATLIYIFCRIHSADNFIKRRQPFSLQAPRVWNERTMMKAQHMNQPCSRHFRDKHLQSRSSAKTKSDMRVPSSRGCQRIQNVQSPLTYSIFFNIFETFLSFPGSLHMIGYGIQ